VEQHVLARGVGTMNCKKQLYVYLASAAGVLTFSFLLLIWGNKNE
jgi:hypothetical protein